MGELVQHIKTHLFEGAVKPKKICSLQPEFVIDSMPCHAKFVYIVSCRFIKLVLYNINIYIDDIDSEDNEADDDDFNLLHQNHLVKVNPDNINETITLLILEFHAVINNLRFDKYLGYFVRVDKPNWHLLNTEIIDLFKDCAMARTCSASLALPNVVVSRVHKFDQCCVCLDETVTKSSCNHYICFRCVVQLHPTPVDNEECECGECEDYQVLCPVCREELTF